MFPILSLPADAGSRLARQFGAWREPDMPTVSGDAAASTAATAPRRGEDGGSGTYGAVALGLAQDVAKGAAQGLIGLVSDAGKGWVMIGDTLVHGGAHIDRIAAFDLRPWSYGPGPRQVAGLAGEMLSPAVAARAVQAGVAGARMAAPVLADEALHFLARQGLLLPVVEHVGRAAGVRLFENQLPHRLAQELAEARALGVKPMRVGDPGFEVLVNEGTIKFVVTESGELLIGPHTRHGVEISHAVLSRGKPVRAAGEAQVMGLEGNYIVTLLHPHSGHFLNGASAKMNAVLQAEGYAAFKRAGVPNFD